MEKLRKTFNDGEYLLGGSRRREQIPAGMQSTLQEFCKTGVLEVSLPRYTSRRVDSFTATASRAKMVANMNKVDAWAQRFFALGNATKDTVASSVDNGYVRCSRKEMFHIRSINDEKYGSAQGQQPEHGPFDLLPSTGHANFLHFQMMASSFLRRVCKLAFQEEEPLHDFVEKLLDKSDCSCLTVFNYPEQEITAEHCPPHTDKGIITLIVNMISGHPQVEVENLDGQWVAHGRNSMTTCLLDGVCPNGHEWQQHPASARNKDQVCSCCDRRQSVSLQCDECKLYVCGECVQSSRYGVTILTGHTLEVVSGGRCRAAVHRIINDGQPRRSLAFKVRGPPDLELPGGCVTIGDVLATFEMSHPSVNSPCSTAKLFSAPDSSKQASRFVLARMAEGDDALQTGCSDTLKVLAGSKNVRLLAIMQCLECKEIACCSPVCWCFQVAAENDALWVRPCLKLGVDWVHKRDSETWSSFYGREFLRVCRWSYPITIGFEISNEDEKFCTITKATRVRSLQRIYSALAREVGAPDYPPDLFLLHRRGNRFVIDVLPEDAGQRIDVLLPRRLPVPAPSRSRVQHALKDGHVLLNGAPVGKPSTKVHKDDQLVWLPGFVQPEDVAFQMRTGALEVLWDSSLADDGDNPMCGDLGIRDGDIIARSGVREARMKRSLGD